MPKDHNTPLEDTIDMLNTVANQKLLGQTPSWVSGMLKYHIKDAGVRGHRKKVTLSMKTRLTKSAKDLIWDFLSDNPTFRNEFPQSVNIMRRLGVYKNRSRVKS